MRRCVKYLYVRCGHSYLAASNVANVKYKGSPLYLHSFNGNSKLVVVAVVVARRRFLPPP